MAVNGYAAAQDVEDLKASTAALAVAMGQRVNSNEAELAAFAETIVPLPGQLEEITNSLSTRLVGTNNLSDLESPATSRTNLGATVVGAAVFTAADAAAARAALGAQAASADLAAIAALTSAEDKLPYATGAGTWSLTNFTAFARTLLASANNSAFLVALGQIASTAINFLQGGTGGVQRGLQDKLRDCISVKDFGAVGDGVTDDAPAFNAALAASVGGLAGRAVYVPGSNARYKIGSTLVVPGGAKLIGDGARSSSFLIKAFNGTFMTIADGGQVHGLRMDGQGATYTGKGIEHIGGNQAVSDLFIYDTGDYTVYFTVTSGANCHYENVTAYVYGSVVGSGVTPGTLKWAFFIEDSASAPGGTPRHFINIKTAGKESFYFGASNNTLISASALYDLGWPVYSVGVREYSRNVTITGCRIASSANLNISGSGNIVGCDIGSKVSLKVSSVYCLGPNLYNNGWEDVSGTPNNLIYSIGDQTYTPVFAVDGTPITLGSAPTPVGYWNRSGRKVTARVRILPAADTVFPVVAAKGVTISLPLPTSALLLQAGVVRARISASSGTNYYCSGYINAGASVAILERDTSGPVTQTSPGSLLAGSAIWATIEYDV